jgi:hypothetical protein
MVAVVVVVAMPVGSLFIRLVEYIKEEKKNLGLEMHLHLEPPLFSFVVIIGSGWWW